MAKKRKLGEGTLRLRSDGRWEGRVVTGYDDKGYPITKNVTSKDKSVCIEKLEELKRSQNRILAEVGDFVDLFPEIPIEEINENKDIQQQLYLRQKPL